MTPNSVLYKIFKKLAYKLPESILQEAIEQRRNLSFMANDAESINRAVDFCTVLNNSGEAVCLVREGRIVSANHSFASLFGYLAAWEIVGIGLKTFISTGRDDEVLPNGNYSAFTGSGNTFYARVSSTLLSSYPDEMRIYFIKDISDLEKIEGELQFSIDNYSLVFHENPLPLAVTEKRSGRFVEVNSAFMNLFGAEKKEEILGRNSNELGITTFGGRYKFYSAPISQTGVALDYSIINRLDGNEFTAEVSWSSIIFAGEEYLIKCYRDVSAHIKIEDELIQSEIKYRRLHKSMMDGFVMVDEEGKIVECNSSYLNMLGYDFKEIAQKNYRELTPTGWHSFEEEILNSQVFVKGYSEFYEKEYIRKDGSIFPVELRVYSLKDKNDNYVGMWGIVRDITERKKAEKALFESESLFRGIFENAGVGAVIVDSESRFVKTNKAFQKMLGYEDVELRGKNFLDITHPDEIESSREQFSQLVKKENDRLRFEKRYIAKTGEPVWVMLTATLVKDKRDNFFYAIALMEDITEKKLVQIELEKYRESLELQVQERTRKLEEVNQRLFEEIELKEESERIVQAALKKERELNDLKSRFISITSHEFRTPLTAIYASAQLMEKYRDDIDPAEYEKNIFRIKKSVNYLTGLLDDILTLNKAETGRLKFSPADINLRKLCNRIAEELKFQLKENLILEVEYMLDESSYYLDEKLITFIIANLLSNAIKYSESGKVIFRINRVDNSIQFVITDSGIGIPYHEQPLLFEPFTRGSNVGTIHGTGLGLSIVKRSVEIHNGTISFDSIEGKGSSFKVKIPIIE